MNCILSYAANDFQILTVPGWRGSGPLHWQTRWETRYGFSRVKQTDWNNPDFSQWSGTLCGVVERLPEGAEIVLVAHSLGCYLVAKSFLQIRNRIKGVFLVAPPDLESGIIPLDLSSFSLANFEKLDVPGYLVYSEDDPYAHAAFSDGFGRDLGIERVNIGRRGHINSDSRLGDWDDGIVLLKRLLQKIQTKEIATR